MSSTRHTLPSDPAPAGARWPTGIATLLGVIIGAAGGVLGGHVPLGTAVGLAAGVGIDSLLNARLNPCDQDTDTNQEQAGSG